MKSGIYRHYKGKNYFVVNSVKQSESDDDLVLYYPLYGDSPSYAVRSATEFSENVVVEGGSRPRFKFLRAPTAAEAQALAAAGPAGIAYQNAMSKAQASVSYAQSTAPSSMGWVQTIITLLGAGIIGLGVILFFAYNWQVIPKYGKLAIIFAGVLLFHGLGMYFGRYLSSEEKSQHALTQGFHLLGTLLFAAGVILIAQIYHIDEHYPNGVAAIAAGTLLMAWVVPSVWQGLLATVLLGAWAGTEYFDFNNLKDWPLLLLVLAVMPLAFILRSRVLLFFATATTWLTAAFWISHFETAFDYGGNHIYIAFVLFAASFLLENTRWRFGATPLRLVAGLYYFFVLFHYAQFGGYSWMGFSINATSWILSKELLVLSVVFIVLSASALGPSLRGEGGGIRSAQIITLLLCFALATGPDVLLSVFFFAENEAFWMQLSPWLSGGFNLVILAHAVLLIMNGLERLTMWRVVLGFVIILALVGFRYFDLLDSLLLRGLIFVVVGTLLFVVGHQYSKRRGRMSGVAYA